jgi:hypothetical protein
MIGISLKTALSGRAEPGTALFLFVTLLAILPPGISTGGELTGQISTDLRLFANEPAHREQERHSVSLALQPEYYHLFDGGSSITLVPFYRYDNGDPERTHFDVREMSYNLVLDDVEFRVGIGKVFWGATEFVHLVDIVNQTDLVEDLDGEDKLGQPLAQLIAPLDWGAFEFFALPYFRERTFPGEGGRFRGSIPVDVDMALYEHPDEEHHVDLAARLSGTAGILDFGLSWFRGTSREPTLLPAIAPNGSPILVPFYEQIEQASVDLQVVAGEWLLKLEALWRNGQDGSYTALAGGGEYTFPGVLESRLDLGVITEYAYDNRGFDSTSAFQDDVMLGLRLALNDFSGSELLVGYIHDRDLDSRILRVEGRRRMGNRMKLTLEAGAFLDVDPSDVLYDLRDDDYVTVTLSYYL